jgi:hypothetical protein
MISYLREQPRTQALAEALRGGQPTNGGSQMAPRTSSFVNNPEIRQPDFNQYGDGAQGGGADAGKLLKSGFNAFKNTDTGKDWMSSISSIFGGSNGADIGRAASQYGPEVAKMGGNVGMTSGGTATSGGGLFGGGGGGMGSMYGVMDNLFGDKFYGKQKGNDETSQTGDAARSALTSAAYSNPWSAAALWADRLLLKGKGMDALTGWLD